MLEEEKAKKTLREEMDNRLLEETLNYVEQYKNDIHSEFPGSQVYSGSDMFLYKWKKAILEDQVPSNCNLTLLRKAHSVLFSDIREIDSYKLYIIYNSLSVLLRNYR